MSVLPRLSRSLVAQPAFPEKVVQFGTGALLRGFIEYFIDGANRAGEFNGSIVAISSTGSSRDASLNEQDGLYTLAIQGGVDGATASEEHRVIGSLARAISARDDWDSVLAVARDPRIELIVSNTTEVGIALDESDTFDARPPRSFPGKLTRFLYERATAFDFDSKRGVVVLPCELIEDNGDTLRRIVGALAKRWALGVRFENWLDESVIFCNTLVDRIVPGALPAGDAARLESSLGYHDDLLTACEAYALFAIQGDDALRTRLGFPMDDSRIIVTPDIRPYRERKVRILNGAHTISVYAALLSGLETVGEAVADERIGRFVRRVMFEEIVPSLDAPDAELFATQVLERFANPFIRHALVDITLHGTAKIRVRIVPSIMEYSSRTGRVPASLAFGFAAYLAFMCGDVPLGRAFAAARLPTDSDGERLLAIWKRFDPQTDAALLDAVRAVCNDLTLWGPSAGLGEIPGFVDAVGDHLIRIFRHGIVAALEAHLTETALT